MKYSIKYQGLEIARKLALESSDVVSYCSEDVTPEDVVEALARGVKGPIWFVWTGTPDAARFTAITGAGPTSQANAMFYANARDIVLELVAEIEELRLPRSC